MKKVWFLEAPTMAECIRLAGEAVKSGWKIATLPTKRGDKWVVVLSLG